MILACKPFDFRKLDVVVQHALNQWIGKLIKCGFDRRMRRKNAIFADPC
jgi:hypothetical protein